MKKPLNKEICAFRERNKERNLHSSEKVVALMKKFLRLMKKLLSLH